MKLIRKDELIKSIQNVVILPASSCGKSYTEAILNNIMKAIETAPTVDAVPVVRCKDCLFSEERHYLGDTVLYCNQFDDFMEESDFCCEAERKDG